MDIEKKSIKLFVNKTHYTYNELILRDEANDNPDMVEIEIIIDGKKLSSKNYDYFSALLDLRKELEMQNIQILCNGSAKNVYPSPMQLSMGTGRLAYKQYMGQQARISDAIDIFDYDESLEFVGIAEQINFHEDWLKSLNG